MPLHIIRDGCTDGARRRGEGGTDGVPAVAVGGTDGVPAVAVGCTDGVPAVAVEEVPTASPPSIKKRPRRRGGGIPTAQ